MDSESILLVIFCLIKKFKRSHNIFYKEKLRHKILKIYALYTIVINEEKSKKKRQFWVRPIFTVERRLLQGASDNLVREIEIQDKEKYVNYFRMDSIIFQKLLELIGPSIVKQHVVRDPIPPKTRLHITLRYLASGDSMTSISYAYRIGHNTVSKIISETCEEIWNALKETVFLHDNLESWQEIADEFEQLWNFPNCLGCIDGTHIRMQVLY